LYLVTVWLADQKTPACTRFRLGMLETVLVLSRMVGRLIHSAQVNRRN
jgi:hypothetical protein